MMVLNSGGVGFTTPGASVSYSDGRLPAFSFVTTTQPIDSVNIALLHGDTLDNPEEGEPFRVFLHGKKIDTTGMAAPGPKSK